MLPCAFNVPCAWQIIITVIVYCLLLQHNNFLEHTHTHTQLFVRNIHLNSSQKYCYVSKGSHIFRLQFDIWFDTKATMRFFSTIFITHAFQIRYTVSFQRSNLKRSAIKICVSFIVYNLFKKKPFEREQNSDFSFDKIISSSGVTYKSSTLKFKMKEFDFY